MHASYGTRDLRLPGGFAVPPSPPIPPLRAEELESFVERELRYTPRMIVWFLFSNLRAMKYATHDCLVSSLPKMTPTQPYPNLNPSRDSTCGLTSVSHPPLKYGLENTPNVVLSTV